MQSSVPSTELFYIAKFEVSCYILCRISTGEDYDHTAGCTSFLGEF